MSRTATQAVPQRLIVVGALLASLLAVVGWHSNRASAANFYVPESNCGTDPLACVEFLDASNNLLAADSYQDSAEAIFFAAPDTYTLMGYSGNDYFPQWSIQPNSDSSFQLRLSNNLGKCLSELTGHYIDPNGLVHSDWKVGVRPCGRNDTAQEWYFEPVYRVRPDGTNSVTIRSVRNDECVDEFGGEFGQQWVPGTLGVYPCWPGGAGQRWHLSSWLPGRPSSPLDISVRATNAANQLAFDYQQTKCSRSPNTCAYTNAQVGAPVAQPTSCVSGNVFYNDSDANEGLSLSHTTTSGFSYSLTEGASVTLGTGEVESVAVRWSLQISFSSSQTWDSTAAQSTTQAGIIPPHQWGYFSVGLVTQPVTGTWTFDVGGTPWTAVATLNVPVTNSSAGSSAYRFSSSRLAPNCSAGGASNVPSVAIETSIFSHTDASGVAQSTYQPPKVGDTIVYAYDVTNTGTVPLNDVKVIGELGNIGGTLPVRCARTSLPATVGHPPQVAGEVICKSSRYFISDVDADTGMLIMSGTVVATPATGGSSVTAQHLTSISVDES